MMSVIIKQRMGFNTTSLYNIVNIAYDQATNVYTLTDTDSHVTTVNGNDAYVFIMITNPI